MSQSLSPLCFCKDTFFHITTFLDPIDLSQVEKTSKSLQALVHKIYPWFFVSWTGSLIKNLDPKFYSKNKIEELKKRIQSLQSTPPESAKRRSVVQSIYRMKAALPKHLQQKGKPLSSMILYARTNGAWLNQRLMQKKFFSGRKAFSLLLGDLEEQLASSEQENSFAGQALTRMEKAVKRGEINGIQDESLLPDLTYETQIFFTCHFYALLIVELIDPFVQVDDIVGFFIFLFLTISLLLTSSYYPTFFLPSDFSWNLLDINRLIQIATKYHQRTFIEYCLDHHELYENIGDLAPETISSLIQWMDDPTIYQKMSDFLFSDEIKKFQNEEHSNLLTEKLLFFAEKKDDLQMIIDTLPNSVHAILLTWSIQYLTPEEFEWIVGKDPILTSIRGIEKENKKIIIRCGILCGHLGHIRRLKEVGFFADFTPIDFLDLRREAESANYLDIRELFPFQEITS